MTPVNRPNLSSTAQLKAIITWRAHFSGWGEYAPRDGRVVQNRGLWPVNADANRAQLEIPHDMMVYNRKMGKENDGVSVSECDSVFLIDLEYTIAPNSVYLLDRNVFGSFDVQCRNDSESWYSTAGEIIRRDPYCAFPNVDWSSEPWYDYTVTASGIGTRLAALQQITIHPHAPLTLRYRTITHDMLQKLFPEWGAH
jgi:hypothetical protein